MTDTVSFPVPTITRSAYNDLPASDKATIGALLQRIWPDTNPNQTHYAQTEAQSFVAMLNDLPVGYCAALTRELTVGDETFRMGWISHVCTHSDYRNQGIGIALMREATEWMVRSGRFDVGLLICEAHNATFYERVGGWERSPELILRESFRPGAYVSDEQNLSVFRLLISPKAILHATMFCRNTLNIDFPEGMFL